LGNPQSNKWDKSAPASDVQDRTGHVAGFLGEQPENSVGDFFGLASTLHRDLSFDAIDSVRFASERVEFGVDVAGTNGIHSDFFFRYLFGQSQSERVDRAFGGSVVNVLVRRTDAGGSGRNVHDAATLASVPSGHAANGFARAEEASEDIGGEDAMQASSVDVLETSLRFDDTDVVDQCCDWSNLFRRSLEEMVDVCFIADIGLDGNGCALFLVDRLNDFFGSSLVAKVVDADAESAGGSKPGSCGSDTATGAGDDDDLGMVGGHVRGF
jgi:hypothetical protein